MSPLVPTLLVLCLAAVAVGRECPHNAEQRLSLWYRGRRLIERQYEAEEEPRDVRDTLLQILHMEEPACTFRIPRITQIREVNNTNAYVTFVTSKDFAMPAAVLMYSIAATGSPYARVVLVTPEIGVHDRRLLSVFAEVIEIENIPAPLPVPNPRYVNTFTKLRVWQLAMYRKVVYVDTDVTVVRNMDELFEIDGWGVTMDAYHDRYSTGLMVLEPSKETFRDMIALLAVTEVSMELPDLLFLKEYFSTRGKQVNIIPRWYHVYQEEFSSGGSFLTNYKSSVPVTDPRIHGIHYPGDSKPWGKLDDYLPKYLHRRCPRARTVQDPLLFWFDAMFGMKLFLSSLDTAVYDHDIAILRLEDYDSVPIPTRRLRRPVAEDSEEPTFLYGVAIVAGVAIGVTFCASCFFGVITSSSKRLRRKRRVLLRSAGTEGL